MDDTTLAFATYSLGCQFCPLTRIEMSVSVSSSGQLLVLCSTCGMTKPLTSFIHPLSPVLLPSCAQCREQQDKRIPILLGCDLIGYRLLQPNAQQRASMSPSSTAQSPKRIRGVSAVPQARCKTVKRAQLPLRKAYVARLVYYRSAH